MMKGLKGLGTSYLTAWNFQKNFEVLETIEIMDLYGSKLKFQWFQTSEKTAPNFDPGLTPPPGLRQKLEP